MDKIAGNICIELKLFPNGEFENYANFIESIFTNFKITDIENDEDYLEDLSCIRLGVFITNDSFEHRFNEIIDILIKEIPPVSHIDYYGEKIMELGLYYYYAGSLELIITHGIFVKMKILMPDFVGLSINAEEVVKIEEPYESAEFYQIFFEGGNIKELYNGIISDKLVYIYLKYKYCITIGMDDEPGKQSRIIVSVCIDLDRFAWNEIYLDIADFVRQNILIFTKHGISMKFGVYHQNYDFGEIGENLIETLLAVNMDMVLTKSICPPPNNLTIQ